MKNCHWLIKFPCTRTSSMENAKQRLTDKENIKCALMHPCIILPKYPSCLTVVTLFACWLLFVIFSMTTTENMEQAINVRESSFRVCNAPATMSRYRRRHQNHRCIHDCAKNGGTEAVWLLCSFYHDPLRAKILRNVDNFAIWARMGFKWKKETW